MGRHSKSHGSYDVESGRSPSPHRSIDFGSTFNSITIRNAFIRKVYGILALQFAFTTLIIFLARNKLSGERISNYFKLLFFFFCIAKKLIKFSLVQVPVHFILVHCKNLKKKI